MSSPLELSVSEFVASLNQTLEYAYTNISITGELANFRVSKGRWVYFDLKDELASIKCFGTVYQLPGPLEDGMVIKVRGVPRMHPQYGFSFNIQTIQPVGEGALKKAADLLAMKLQKEGLFDLERKRPILFPPSRVGLITSSESAAYADFIKIIGERWRGVDIDLIDVLVQGDLAPAAITGAVTYFNERAEAVDVLVIIRGGGSPEDLWAFNTEQVTRAVAASRIPTLVAIGHEVDISLAELAADLRASTPSNAAELLVPDRQQVSAALLIDKKQLDQSLRRYVEQIKQYILLSHQNLDNRLDEIISGAIRELSSRAQLLEALSPNAALKRGYAIVRQSSKLVRRAADLKIGSSLEITLADAEVEASVNRVQLRKEG